MSYPVTFEVDYVEQRDRLSTFFRTILAIPLYILLLFYGIAAWFAVVFAWFAIVFTGRYPQGLYDFNANFIRMVARATAFGALLVDRYPPFNGAEDASYPVRMEFGGPLVSYSRAKTFFRGILAFPIMILRYYVIQPLLNLAAFGAWFVIVFTGKLSRGGLYDMMVLANSYTARADAYLFLLTETYPPFQDEQTRAAGVVGGVGA